MAKETRPKAAAASATTASKRVRRPATRRRTAAPATAPITHDHIALRAYELHEAGVDGDAMAHWLRAERELVGV